MILFHHIITLLSTILSLTFSVNFRTARPRNHDWISTAAHNPFALSFLACLRHLQPRNTAWICPAATCLSPSLPSDESTRRSVDKNLRYCLPATDIRPTIALHAALAKCPRTTLCTVS
eukprot:CAMPEP_0172006266 /NCGR_PEP_ID=MMETSP1041-20130122/5478_1 /TAXON_ID=464988 /ORGANISM="Hemiselmis andersenii, Strain CCMP439" /LENGTH=117 /DNA_ID=CAMNT_0012660295 /DNA_START=62 /DNA_END=412 /DNA_ORIENTATION=-